MGLLTAKGDINDFSRNGKKSIYIVVELDDMEGHDKIRCTLWEEFVTKLVKHIEKQKTSEYIIIMQFAKFNMFKGTLGISNTNYNSILYINLDFQEVKDFRKRIIMFGVPFSNQLSKIAADPAYNLEDDLLNQSTYKPICELKELFEDGSFVTIGTIVALDSNNGWWYKGCKQCFHSLKEADNSYHCTICDTFPTSHTPRYSINLRVADDTNTTSFIIYDKEATKFFGSTASELRLAQLTRGGINEKYPIELDSFKNKKFLFKVSVKIEDINSFQPCKIIVIKICGEISIIFAFVDKYNIYDKNLGSENSELMSIQTGSTYTIKGSSSSFAEILGDDNNDSFTTPKNRLIPTGLSEKLIDLYPANVSSSKCRKVIIDEEGMVEKLHED
ncbi:replication protein A 70 kDa DNA-binding subunit D-like [Arachis hypogaea]|uniref:replication protein A 70 kDa DNA-binding subunit D-like n=1 Tax=Arachis hypogaea TaxID=3818 RepID=UPI000DEDC699|nr:uncharacterized protein LOC112778262 [Arachis hypogaea]